MAYDLPDLDPRDEDLVTADVIASLPAEISDRNRSNPEIKLIEACGAFYGSLLVQLNKWTTKLAIAVLDVLDVQQELAERATVTLEFTADAVGATIPGGTVVKTGRDADAVKYATDGPLVVGSHATGAIAATAVDAGGEGNVGANTLTYMDQPVSGVVSVTNPVAASGGQDTEPLAAMQARAPLAIRAMERAITDEDFAYHAARVAGVERAVAFGDGSGSVVVHLLATDLNEVPSAPLGASVKSDLESRTLPGVVVTTHQPQIRFIRLTQVEVALQPGAFAADVANAITAAMLAAVTAVAQYDLDGVTVLHPAWPWGQTLYLNDLIALISRIEGVRRVGGIEASQRLPSGLWAFPAPLTEIPAGADDLDNPNYGLLHYFGGSNPTIVVL